MAHVRLVPVSTAFLIGTLAATVLVALGWQSEASLASDDMPYPCVDDAIKQALPAELELGGVITVTLGFRLSCPDETRAVHKVVVIDQTTGDRRVAGKASIGAGAIYWMNLDTHPASKVGVVGFSRTAHKFCDLTHDHEDISHGMWLVRPDGDIARIDTGITMAATMLRAARRDADPWRPLDEGIVLVTGGKQDGSCRVAAAAAGRAARDGIYTFAACAGSDCDVQCINKINAAVKAAGVNDFEPAPDLMPPTGIRRLIITDTLAANMRLVATSVVPAADWIAPDGSQIVWRVANVAPSTWLTYTYQVEPTEIGQWPVGAGAVAAFEDGRGREGTIAFPQPTVRVVAAPATVTPVASATPTTTVSPTSGPSTMTRTIAAPPTPTTTPRPATPAVKAWAVYAPAVERW